MAAHLITNEEAIALRDALLERGEIKFPLGLVGPFLSRTIYRIQKSNEPFTLRFRNRLVAKLSDGYASVLAFLLWVGPENVKVWTEPAANDGEGARFLFVVRAEPNKTFKRDPSGPDAAALRRLN